MTWLTSSAKKFLRDETGVSVIEYALLLALVAMVCVGAMTLLGSAINNLFAAGASI